ncbi:MAG: hypothetical protein KIS67_21590, partial [Verrucomicrobiae bacterium]|nr:hypothetical protein [Verrucomicrobiae bacterium]
MKTSSQSSMCRRQNLRRPLLAHLATRVILPSLAAAALLLGVSTARAGIWVTNTFTTPGAGEWIAPVGVTTIIVEAWGAGGGGGGDNDTGGDGAGGGGGGAYARLNFYTVIPGNPYGFTVGAGGGGGTGSGSGSPGGNSFFVDTSTLNALGGSQGSGGNSGAGGVGGSAGASTGDVTFGGGAGMGGSTLVNDTGGGGGGSAGPTSNGNSATATGGTGAAAVEGGGAGGSGGFNLVGGEGFVPGGGGAGGGHASGGAKGGGAGASGQVRIIYYDPTVEIANFSTPGSTLWTAPAGITQVTVETWGGGGRGSTGTSDGEYGGGGGGAYSAGTVAVVPGTDYTVVVGAGSSGTGAGGDSYFIAMSSGNVGAKGGNSAANNSTTGATGGAAASGFGTTKFSGGNGANGSNNNYGGGGGSSAGPGGEGVNGTTSNGGVAPTGGGNGGNGATVDDNPGLPGLAPGGGGGGARRNNNTVLGGTGADGLVRISFAVSDDTIAGTATAVAAGTTSIGVTMPFFGDANQDNSYTVQYKFTSGSTWVTWIEDAAYTISPYTTTITGLGTATSYDVRVTYNDPDGVSGDSTQTITGVTTDGGDIAVLNDWSNLYHGTSTSQQNINYPVPTGSDAQRVLVVAIASGRTGTGTRTVTVTYGGQALTLVNGDMGNSTKQHTALYYLDESGLDAATSSTLSVTVGNGTTRVTDVFAAVFDNVDQSSPVTDSKNYSSGISEVTTFTFGTALTVNVRNQAIAITTSHRNSSTTIRTISSLQANWSLSAEQTWTTSEAVRNFVTTRTIPTSDTTATHQTSMNNSSLGSMTALSLTAAKYSPNVIWPTASSITLGQSLSASTLNDDGEASVPGTFAFTDDSMVPDSVGIYSASVTFTPTDTATYNAVVGSVDVTVIPDEASVSEWPTASAITYGQPLSASSLIGGTASVPGTFAFTDDTIVPDGVGIYSASVTFTPNDTETYDPIVGSVDVLVNQAIPNVTTWPTASAITYGQALSASTLSGGDASVSGTFAFAAPATVPPAGTYGASVVFTPEDITNYETVANTVEVLVNQATPDVTSWPSASGITYGDALAASSLTGGEASVPGTFAFTDDAILPNAGNYPASVTFTPSDAANYNLVTDTVSVAVAPKTLTPSVVLNNREYDGTTTATTIASRDLLGGVVGEDDVSLGASGTVAPFSSAAVDSYTIEVSELSLTGEDADNYELSTTSVSVSAAITPKELTIAGAVANDR